MLLACCVVIKERGVCGAAAMAARLQDDQRRRVVDALNEIAGLLVHVVHLLLLLHQEQMVVVNGRRRVMRRVGSVVELVPLKVVQRQCMPLELAGLVILRQLVQLRLSVIVVAVVVVVCVILDTDGRSRLAVVRRNQSKVLDLARRVRLILLALLRDGVFHLTHREGTVGRCTIWKFHDSF